MIVKKTFSARWMKRLSDNWNGIVGVLHGTFVCHDRMDEAMNETYDYLFTVAKASGVTAKNFAKTLADKGKLNEYTSKVVDAMMDLHVKEIEAEEIAKAKEEKKAAKAKNKA